ncbi:MAG: FliH/SctL family protein [Phycisphaerales bacterium JB063]
MPVLKAQLAPPAMKEAIVLDLGDLGAQAAKIRMRAEAEAERLIEEAHAKAASIVAEREADADARGYAAGLERGRAEGQEQGKAQALTDAQEEIARLTSAWSDVSTQWESQRVAMERDARQSVTAFALRAVEKIVHRVIETDPDTVTRQVGAALEMVLSQHDIVVRIHPDDRVRIEDTLPRLVTNIGGLGHVLIADDPDIGPGGCALAFGSGHIDATIEKQLERITDLLLPGTSDQDIDDHTGEDQAVERSDATTKHEQAGAPEQPTRDPADPAGTPDPVESSDHSSPPTEPGA